MKTIVNRCVILCNSCNSVIRVIVQVYENLRELLVQLAANIFTPDIERNLRVENEIVSVRGWQWCLPNFTSVPSQV